MELKARVNRAAERANRSPAEITIVAVSKGVDSAAIEKALEAGITNIGENRVQEAMTKIEVISSSGLRPIWHMVGHLQRNKVKTALELFDIIHSIDSLRLAEALSRQAENIIPVLIQVNIPGEETKSGFPQSEVSKALEEIASLPGLRVDGLMTIAPLTDDPEEVRPIFRRLRELRDSLGLEHLSMGMTDDFEVAIEEGATMVRIGRAIFGERNQGR